MKEENSVQSGVSMTSLEGNSSRGETSRKTVMGRESSQYCRKEKGHIRAKPEIAQSMMMNQPKSPRERGQEYMLHGTVTIKKRIKVKF